MSSLTIQQVETLNAAKAQLRAENEKYLRQHPELKSLLSYFMTKLLEERPEDAKAWAEAFFIQKDLRQRVEKFRS